MRKKILQYTIIFSILFLVGSMMFMSYSYMNKVEPATIKIHKAKMAWGIDVDTLIVSVDTVGEGQNLSEILKPYAINSTDIEKIVHLNDSIFDVRRIRAGNQYSVIHTRGKTKKGLHFIYNESDTIYYIIDLSTNFKAKKYKKEVTIIQKQASGAINGSLWKTFEDLNLNPELAMMLSDIYQWSIDFYAIQDNDLFKLIYDEKFVDGKSVGFGKIHAAWFCASGDSVYAIPFTQDSVASYFNKDGASLRKAFLKAPLKFRRISSGFSNSRLHPILRIRRPHHGVDYSAPSGTPVSTIGDGVVIQAGWSSGGGKTVKIKHVNGYVTSYMHLSGFGKGISNGSRIRQGDIIGYVGSTGLSTGPHLDFRVYHGGTPIDPSKMISPPTDPIKKESLNRFAPICDSITELLNSMKMNLDSQKKRVQS